MTVDHGLLAHVADEWESSRTICERAGIDSRTGGQRLRALVRVGLVVSAPDDDRGINVYRRGPEAPPIKRELLLYELDVEAPVAHVDRHGQVWKRGEANIRLASDGHGGLLPEILFADVPVALHLKVGIMLAPRWTASQTTGPAGWGGPR